MRRPLTFRVGCAKCSWPTRFLGRPQKGLRPPIWLIINGHKRLAYKHFFSPPTASPFFKHWIAKNPCPVRITAEERERLGDRWLGNGKHFRNV